MKKPAITVTASLCALVLCAPFTLAYIDPASTSYIIQIIAGVVVAAGASIAIFWKKIQLFFKRKKIERLEKKLTKEGESRDSTQP